MTLAPEEYTQKLIESVNNGELPKGELNCLHIRYGQKEFDPSTGRLLDNKKIQTYDVKEWGDTPERGVQGYLREFPNMEIEILYDPRAKRETASGRGRKKAAETEPLAEVAE